MGRVDDAASMVAALFVETCGVYYGLPGVDPWDEERDARLYAAFCFDEVGGIYQPVTRQEWRQ